MYHTWEVCYAEYNQKRCRIDFFLPTQRLAPISLLFIHGGGWEKGGKESWRDVAVYFAERGFATASTGYRLAPDYRYPAQIEDVRLAMQRVKQWNRELGLAADKVVAIGSSSGGYLAAMLAMITPHEELGVTEKLVDLETRPYGVICYCPVTTLELRRPFVERFMGGPFETMQQVYLEASPLHRIRGGEPPFLLLQGDCDTTTSLGDTKRFHERLLVAGISSRLEVLHGVGHGFGYGASTEAQGKSIRAIESFLDDLVKR
ncbi:alpha/beta hydrolase [Paenibacillus sp. RC67]|uniref:alpha/beta hydrolase n=1 Tax=Paenibacillus sp. RC67 TaxID=3039392 RepID=UPI0024ADD28E|nr:alpha/beta hydrolase [Paenibacillus sp. RC67]